VEANGPTLPISSTDEPHRAIPRHGCVPAEPASVSPGLERGEVTGVVQGANGVVAPCVRLAGRGFWLGHEVAIMALLRIGMV
jgi:hypothetical protein